MWVVLKTNVSFFSFLFPPTVTVYGTFDTESAAQAWATKHAGSGYRLAVHVLSPAPPWMPST